ncbi:MAG: hypothetical protein IPI67_42010 [Myxococcales bacterium]|nr:hypothetical protein [Myxococcales bacterium]
MSDTPETTALAPAAKLSFERSLVLSALLYAACRFVPLPFADDVFRSAVGRLIVGRALELHGRSFSAKEVAPLYSESVGCTSGCLMALPMILAKLILFPLRKLLALLGAARGISRDLCTALLLGRSVERCLVRGLLPEGGERRESDAKLIRGSFDRALAASDLSTSRLLLGAAALASKRSLAAAGRAVAAMFQKRSDASPGELAEEERDAVNQGAENLEGALDDPRVVQEIEAFDARFDEQLTRSGLH